MIDLERISLLISNQALPINSCEKYFVEGYEFAKQEKLFKDCIWSKIEKLVHVEYIYLTLGYAMGQAELAIEEENEEAVSIQYGKDYKH